MVLSHELTGQTIRLARPDISKGTGAPVRPQAIRVWVERPAVMRLLDDSTTRTLTVVTAPAGTGKTLTVARWSAAQTGSPVTWVSSASGMDPQHLANLLRATAGLPAYPRGSSRKVMIERTAESLARRSAEQIVVIDDAHLMSTQCFTVIDELLSHANKYTAALYLGRSTQTGVGCDDTRGPHTELHPVVKTIPSDAAAARQAFPGSRSKGGGASSSRPSSTARVADAGGHRAAPARRSARTGSRSRSCARSSAGWRSRSRPAGVSRSPDFSSRWPSDWGCWILLAQATGLEDRSAIGGLRRSSRLVAGRWLRVAFVVGAGGALVIAAGPLLGAFLVPGTDAPLPLLNVVAAVVCALAMPYVALTTTYLSVDARVQLRARAAGHPRDPAGRGRPAARNLTRSR